MVFVINSSQAGNSPAHALSDFSELLLQSHPKDKLPSYIHRAGDECFKLSQKKELLERENFVDTRYEESAFSEDFQTPSSSFRTLNALTPTQLLDLFQNYVSHAKTTDDEQPKLALSLLEGLLRKEYYSGTTGRIANFLHKKSSFFDFTKTREGLQLAAISQKIASLKPTPKMEIPKIEKRTSVSSVEKDVFTDNPKDSEALGAISYGECEIVFMTPKAFLLEVDPYFKRHPDEHSLPGLLREMADLANGKKKGTKFAPLMIDRSGKHKICDGYTILDHEGRHRAWAAYLLGMEQVPVAVIKGKGHKFT